MKRLLVVEDNLDSARLVQWMLEDLAIEIDFATSGEEALETAGASSYDIILLDIGLPGISGLEVLSQLRKTQEYRAVPIIAFSAHLNVNLKPGSEAEYFTNLVRKPFTEKKLKDGIAAYL